MIEVIVLHFFTDLIKTIIKLIQVIEDALTLKLPQKSRKDGFAFLVHPRDITDIYRPYPFFRYLPNKWVLWFVKFLPPITLSKITGLKSIKDGRPIKGWLISTVLTPQHIKENPEFVVKKTLQLSVLAQKKGAKIIGLGALIPSLTKYGIRVAKHLNGNGTGVTTGHAYTSWVIADTTTKAMMLCGMDANDQIAILGAGGSTGSTCARILAKKCNKILLIDLPPKKKTLENLANELSDINKEGTFTVSSKIEDIYYAYVVVAVTNAHQSIIKSEYLRSGTVVIDDAQPPNVSEEAISGRNDVIVLKVLAHTPGIDCHFDFGLPNREDVFTCLAETMALAANEWEGNFSVGQVTMSQVKKIIDLAEKAGFHPSGMTTFTGHVGSNDIERIYNIKLRQLASLQNLREK